MTYMYMYISYVCISNVKYVTYVLHVALDISKPLKKLSNFMIFLLFAISLRPLYANYSCFLRIGYVLLICVHEKDSFP